MTTSELYIAHSNPVHINTNRFDVKQRETAPLLGENFQLNVIGSSHWITCPELEFSEIISCEQLNENTHSLTLSEGYSKTVEFVKKNVEGVTTIECIPLNEFPHKKEFDVAYQFGPDAYTTITLFSTADGYTTHHTYPEHDIAVFSETEFS